MMCIRLFSYGRPVVVRCMGVRLVWVGLGQLLSGLGWAGSMKIDPRTTLKVSSHHITCLLTDVISGVRVSINK